MSRMELVRDLNEIINVEIMPLGQQAPRTALRQVESGLWHLALEFDLTETVAQDDWQIRIQALFTPTFHWAPHLTPDPENIIDQHVFRAPAIVFTDDHRSLAVLPDLDCLATFTGPERWYMDMDARSNVITLGLSRYEVSTHVLFKRSPGAEYKPGKLSYGFFIMLSRDPADCFNPWRRPMQFLWQRHGHALFEQAAPLGRKDLTPFVEHTYRWAFENWPVVWQEFDLDGKRVGAPAFIVTQNQSPNCPWVAREREVLSIWNQAWFSSLRSASGLYRYARRTGRADLLKRALMTKELALSAPLKDGLFPSIRACKQNEKTAENGEKYLESESWATSYWGNSNRNPRGMMQNAPFHILDMSWTALLMLRWYEELEKDDRLLDYAVAHGKALLRWQDPDGFFPAWISQKDLSIEPELRQSPESAMCVTFLLKLADLTGEAAYRDAALRCMDALLKEIVPSGRWEDFETYWSCCRWGTPNYIGKKIERNDMYKQCNLSIFWTAEALLAAYKVTKNDLYLKWGQRTMDELLTFQAVWQPPYMYVNVFGGFAVMNCDGEWIDARQSLFAELILEYGEILGVQEYRERGLAAMRASFAMMYCPELPIARKQWEAAHRFFGEKDFGFMMENYGHSGTTSPTGGGVGVFTIYDWGNGAAAEAWNRLLDHHGSDFVTM